MVGHTNRYGRYIYRLLAPEALLYSEMIVDQSILRGQTVRLLAFDPSEHPVIAQIAGAQPENLASAAKIILEYGYDGINLNIGCPSPKTRKGKFGACLFSEPGLVRDMVYAVKETIPSPVSVKCRLGTEHSKGFDDFQTFIETVSEAMPESFIVHARIAVLEGLNTTQNLNVPPLRYEYVQRIKQDFPELKITLNGGLRRYEEVKTALMWADGVMLGRLALNQPRELFDLYDQLAGINRTYNPFYMVRQYATYVDGIRAPKPSMSVLLAPIRNLLDGYRGAKQYRSYLGSCSRSPHTLIEIVEQAMTAFSAQEQDAQAH